MSADRWDHKKSCPCLACREADRYFANALRNWLGLAPLYYDGRSKKRVERDARTQHYTAEDYTT